MTQGDPRVTQDDPRVTQDDPRADLPFIFYCLQPSPGPPICLQKFHCKDKASFSQLCMQAALILLSMLQIFFQICMHVASCFF